MFRLTTNVLRMKTPQHVSDTLAEVVQEAMRSAGLSQRAVAETTGIPLVTLNRKLTKKHPFTIPEIASIAEAVDIGVTELFLRVERTVAADAAA